MQREAAPELQEKQRHQFAEHVIGLERRKCAAGSARKKRTEKE
jgi:hypothetical protein